VAKLASKLFARSLELPTLAADAAGPGILAQSVNHGSPNATFGERLELDTAPLIKPVRCVDEPYDTILDKISDVDRVGHRGRNTSGKLLYEGNAGNNARILRNNLGAHECDLRRHVRQLRYQPGESARIPVQSCDVGCSKLLCSQHLNAFFCDRPRDVAALIGARNRQTIDETPTWLAKKLTLDLRF
jgi:hypothetical protein